MHTKFISIAPRPAPLHHAAHGPPPPMGEDLRPLRPLRLCANLTALMQWILNQVQDDGWKGRQNAVFRTSCLPRLALDPRERLQCAAQVLHGVAGDGFAQPAFMFSDDGFGLHHFVVTGI